MEDEFAAIVVNAAHIKAVPGRKTDVKDAEWIAELLRHGLLRASFIPDRAQRELRELTRYRRSLVQERSREANRIQKLLEGAHVKLSSVATDVLGVSGRAMLAALAAGEEDPEALADLARGQLRKKREELQEALRGLVQFHQRFMLASQLRHLEYLEAEVERLDEEVARRVAPFEDMVAAVDTIPGVGRRTAEVIAAEIGVNPAPFLTPGHLASWAGVCPSNKQSGEKRQRGPTRKGNGWLKPALVEAARSAGRTKTYLGGSVPSAVPAHRRQPGRHGSGPLHRRHHPPHHQERADFCGLGPQLLPRAGPGGHHPPGGASARNSRPQSHPRTHLNSLFSY